MWRRRLQPRQPTGSNLYPTRIGGYARRSRVTSSRQGVTKFERTRSGDGCWDFGGRWEGKAGERNAVYNSGQASILVLPFDYRLTLIKFSSTRELRRVDCGRQESRLDDASVFISPLRVTSPDDPLNLKRIFCHQTGGLY